MERSGNMNIVKVRLRKPRRVFSFLCGDISLSRGDNCVVHSDRGPEWGVCLLPPEPCSEEVGKRITMRILRKANFNDEQTYSTLADEETKARKICIEKIQYHKLDMKLVDVEYTFDKRKIIFYFTAEERVDFRELVRDLAHSMRTRIELRHIQVRDEAKMVGGLGCCGRELCCSSWMCEFKPISMRMAKRQDLSLNPTKISGQCGRLLCCLSYENEAYEPLRKKKARQKAEQEAEQAAEENEAGEDAGSEKEVAQEKKAEDTAPEQVPPDDAGEEGVEIPAGDAVEEEAGQDESGNEEKDGETKPAQKKKRRRKNRRKKKRGSGGKS